MKKLIIILVFLLVACGKKVVTKIAPLSITISSNKDDTAYDNGEEVINARIMINEKISFTVSTSGEGEYTKDYMINAYTKSGLSSDEYLDELSFQSPVEGFFTIVVKSIVDENINSRFYLEVINPITLTGDNEIRVGNAGYIKVSSNHDQTIKKVSYKSIDERIASVDEEGKIIGISIGKGEIMVTVVLMNNVTFSLSHPINIIANIGFSNLAGGENGINISYKYASVDEKVKILSAMEKYLIDEGASIPLFNNSEAILYSSRIKLPTKDYVPIMGRGALYSTLKTGNATGTKDDPAYRIFSTSSPKTLNHLIYKDSAESSILNLCLGSLYSMEYINNNGEYDGYQMIPSMASHFPIAIDDKYQYLNNFDYKNDTSKSWIISLNKDLSWVNHEGKKVVDITADDFIYTYMQLLDPVQKNSRANALYGSTFPVLGAEEYFKQTAVERKENGNYDINFNSVGIKKIDDYTIAFLMKNDYRQWDIMYNLSSFVLTPVYKELYESLMGDKETSYGKIPNKATEPNTILYSGKYYVTYLEDLKEIRFEKNPHYVYRDLEQKPTMQKISQIIVKDSNAALALFKSNELDVVSIPASEYDNYKTDPGLYKNPGSTTFRLSVNQFTQSESDAFFGKNAWKTKPILRQKKFLEALYYAINREELASTILKTATPDQFYFTNAYVIDPEKGTSYRELSTNIFKNYDTDTYGYNPDYAVDCYKEALKNMIEQKIIKNGDSISFEIASFDGATHEALLDYLKDKLEGLFNSQKEYNIKLNITTLPCANMNVYYEKQMVGKYDLAIAGLSGGLLDPANFMECFCDDNRSGLLLNRGVDTHNPLIKINLDINNDNILDGDKYWSFDALYSALTGVVFVKQGVEANDEVYS